MFKGPKKTEQEEKVLASEEVANYSKNILDIETKIQASATKKDQGLEALVKEHSDKVYEYNLFLQENGVRKLFGKSKLDIKKLEQGFPLLRSYAA